MIIRHILGDKFVSFQTEWLRFRSMINPIQTKEKRNAK